MNNRPHRLQRGLTLIELLVASTIGILVIGAAIAVFSANQTIGRTTEHYQLAQDDFRYVSQIMTRVVRDGASFAGTTSSALVVTYPNPTGGLSASGLRNCLGALPIGGETNRFALTQQGGGWALGCAVSNTAGNQTQTLMEGLVGNGFSVALLKPSMETGTLGALVPATATNAADASSVEITIRMRRANAPNDVQTRFVVTMRCRVLGGCP